MRRGPPRSTLFPYTTRFRSAALRKTADPTIEKVQLDAARQFLADASGRIVLTPQPDGSGAGAPQVSSGAVPRSEEHTSELQSRQYLVCRLLLEIKTKKTSSS